MSRCQVAISWRLNSANALWPQARAMTFMSSTDAWKKLASRAAERSTSSLWTIIGVADARRHAADRLHGAVGKRNAVRPQRQRLDEIAGYPQTPGDDQGHASAGAVPVQVVTRTRQRRHGRHADVIAKQQRCGAGAATAAIQDDVVGAGLQGKTDIAFDMVGAQLETDRNAPA